MRKTIFMLSAAVVMSMAASSCKADSAANAESQESIEMNEAVQDEGPVAEPVVIKVDTVGYTTTPSGLQYKKVNGKGAATTHPTANDVVTVHYTGRHLDGTTFDSSVDRGEPATFPLNRVIPGWTEGVQLMTPGDTYQFIIPSNLAYGPTGTPGGPIAPNEDLYFEVTLIDIAK